MALVKGREMLDIWQFKRIKIISNIFYGCIKNLISIKVNSIDQYHHYLELDLKGKHIKS